jgi:hypothetical protein
LQFPDPPQAEAPEETKRAAVEAGLRLPVRMRKQVDALEELKGPGWEGDLNETRPGPAAGPILILAYASAR